MMKITINICLIALLVHINVLFTMEPEPTKGTLLEKLGENHQEDTRKLKDAYLHGKSSASYIATKQLELEDKRNGKYPIPKKLNTILTQKDVPASIIFLAEGRLQRLRESVKSKLLHKAAGAGFVPFCLFLLETQIRDINWLDHELNTPLHKAAKRRPKEASKERTDVAAQKSDIASLETCKLLLKRGARIDLENKEGRTPLYLAAICSESVPLTNVLITECPSIKATLKTILLSCRRWQIRMPKDVLLICIAPYIIFNATESKLAIIKPLITEVLESKTVYLPNPMAGRNILVQTEQRLCSLVKNAELHRLLDPHNIEQLRIPITQGLYASIGITSADKK